ncbi:MAG: FecR protein, partial [Phycisphaerales bacterium]|nr:FecR protein [Phycisphaerales bacterium]
PALPAEPPAVLAAVLDAQWDGDPDEAPSLGRPLPEEALSLAAGFARVALSNGVTVVAEGPARFRVASERRVELFDGRLSANVPPGARGFTVRTPTAEVVDFGTEFGVGVAAGGASRVQVFTGQVSLAAGSVATTRPSTAAAPALPAGAGPARPPTFLTAGSAREVSGGGAVAAVPGDSYTFVRPAQFESWRAAAASGSSYARWRAYSERLRRDPSLALYYTFDDPAAAPGVVANQAAVTAGRFDAVLGGPTLPARADGRLPGKRALAFAAPARQRALVTDYPFTRTGRMTVAAWVNARSLPAWAAIAKCRGLTEPGQFSFGHEATTGQLVARVTLADGTEVRVPQPGATGVPLPVGRWAHVAFTADGVALHVYLDGRVVGSCPAGPVVADPVVRSLAIGYRTGDDGASPVVSNAGEYWDGAIDELAVFHRALSLAEVARMAAAGGP